MKSKRFWVWFTSNNARILRSPEEVTAVTSGFVIESPDLSRVEGFPPHFWKVIGQEVHLMTPAEQAERVKQHEQFGVDNGRSDHAPDPRALELQALKAAARAAWLGGLIAGFFVGGFWGSVITALILG